MADDTSTPGSGFDSASWLARDQEFVRLCKSTLSDNKAAFFDVLAGARIDTVEVAFNGYADEGQIDGAVADRIFEPFFTLHRTGTGLGLFLARELAECNGALLVYESRSGGGSIFRLIFADPQRWQEN